MLTALWVGVVVGTVVSWIGLLNLVWGARPLYLGSWMGYLMLALLSGPAISTSFGYAAQMLLALVGGTIVGLVYFSDLRTTFRPLGEALKGLAGGAATDLGGRRTRGGSGGRHARRENPRHSDFG